MGERLGMGDETEIFDVARDFIEIDDLPGVLRTCASLAPTVQVILPARAALQLARRIEAGRPKAPSVALDWIDQVRAQLRWHVVAAVAAALLLALVVVVTP